jgi:hypothetical protein
MSGNRRDFVKICGIVLLKKLNSTVRNMHNFILEI